MHVAGVEDGCCRACGHAPPLKAGCAHEAHTHFALVAQSSAASPPPRPLHAGASLCCPASAAISSAMLESEGHAATLLCEGIPERWVCLQCLECQVLCALNFKPREPDRQASQEQQEVLPYEQHDGHVVIRKAQPVAATTAAAAADIPVRRLGGFLLMCIQHIALAPPAPPAPPCHTNTRTPMPANAQAHTRTHAHALGRHPGAQTHGPPRRTLSHAPPYPWATPLMNYAAPPPSLHFHLLIHSCTPGPTAALSEHGVKRHNGLPLEPVDPSDDEVCDVCMCAAGWLVGKLHADAQLGRDLA